MSEANQQDSERNKNFFQVRWPSGSPTRKEFLMTLPASITTTLRKKGTLSTSSWLPAHALDSFVALPSAKRFPAKTDPD